MPAAAPEASPAAAPEAAPAAAGTAQASSAFALHYLEFESKTLQRRMPFTVFLPPGYDSSEARYPSLYMLHGASGTNREWENYRIFEQAARMMLSGEITPFIIVLPQGDQSYWVDHANGEAWGRYVARDLVDEVGSRFRTQDAAASRAIGGLSMGADGALQIAINFPNVFGAVGLHSPVLRAYADAPAFYGDLDYFNAHSVPSLVEAKPDIARGLIISIDTGDRDLWLAAVTALHEQLLRLNLSHEWHIWEGEHNAAYWTAHVPDGLRFYSSSFRR